MVSKGGKASEDAIIDALGGEENLAVTEDEIGNVRAQMRDLQLKTK